MYWKYHLASVSTAVVIHWQQSAVVPVVVASILLVSSCSAAASYVLQAVHEHQVAAAAVETDLHPSIKAS